MIEGLVSVITPVYKVENLIETTINSVLNQTYKKIEMILVDDCSPDKSADIILEYAKTYPQIRYYRLDKNSGAAVARNKAIELAEGQYIAFLDSDDVWKSEKIEKEVELSRKKNVDFVFTAIEMINEHGNLVKSKRKIEECIDYKFLMTNTMIATSSVLIDISKVGKFQMPLIRSGQDYATWLMLLRDGRKAYGINEALTQYRRTEGSLSSKKTKNWKKVWRIQVEEEGISPMIAYLHCAGYIFNALKKYIF
jgi:teichuronic acid biosynthesis glycosyltransferase TuaG